MRSFFKKSLSRQIILGVSLIHALLMTIFVGDFIIGRNIDLEDSFNKSSFEFAELIAKGSIHWVLSSDFIGIEEIIENANLEDTSFVEIIDAQGKVLGHTNRDLVGKFISDQESLTLLKKESKPFIQSQDKEGTLFVSPIKKGDQIIGWVRMKRENDILISRSNDLIRTGLLFTFMAIILGGFLSWFLVRGVTEDLLTIAKATTELKEGNNQKRVHLDREDELATLATNFNGLLDHLSEDQTEIQETKTKLALALEGSGLGVWDWDLTTNKVTYDKNWAKILGYEIDEIEMDIKTWESRVHPEDLPSYYEDINNYLEGKIDHYDNTHRLKHKDGSWIYTSGKGRFSAWDESGKPTRFTGTILDVRESFYTYHEKLKELKAILDASPSCVKVVDKNGSLVEMNDHGLRLIEANNFEEVKGANVYDLVVEEDRERFIELNNKVTSGENAHLVFKIRGLNRKERIMETYAAPIKLPNG